MVISMVHNLTNVSSYLVGSFGKRNKDNPLLL